MSPSDFDFCLPSPSDHSTADELFSDGKLLPLPLKPHPPKPEPTLKHFISIPHENVPDPPKPTSFWRFGRSRSTNTTNTNRNTGSAFGRSKSTGARSQRQLRRSGSVGKLYYYGCSESGVSISPVLNVPMPCVLPRSGSGSGGSGSNGFFGLGVLLCRRNKSLFCPKSP